MDPFSCGVISACCFLVMLIDFSLSSQQPWNQAHIGHSQATLNEKDIVCDHICPQEVVPKLSAPKNGITRDDEEFRVLHSVYSVGSERAIFSKGLLRSLPNGTKVTQWAIKCYCTHCCGLLWGTAEDEASVIPTRGSHADVHSRNWTCSWNWSVLIGWCSQPFRSLKHIKNLGGTGYILVQIWHQTSNETNLQKLHYA